MLRLPLLPTQSQRTSSLLKYFSKICIRLISSEGELHLCVGIAFSDNYVLLVGLCAKFHSADLFTECSVICPLSQECFEHSPQSDSAHILFNSDYAHRDNFIQPIDRFPSHRTSASREYLVLRQSHHHSPPFEKKSIVLHRNRHLAMA